MKSYYTKLTLALAIVFSGCGTRVSLELKQAKDVISFFIEPMNLKDSMFPAAYPECKPSQFVDYILSAGGAAELPSSEGTTDEGEKEENAVRGMTYWPSGVQMFAEHPNMDAKKQIVLKSDDAKGVIIVECYEDPASKPVATYELKLVKVEASPRSQLAFQSNVEMGMSFGRR